MVENSERPRQDFEFNFLLSCRLAIEALKLPNEAFHQWLFFVVIVCPESCLFLISVTLIR